MITNLKQISYSDYLLGSTLPLPPLGAYYVRHSLTEDGILLGAYLAEEPVGIAVIELAPRALLAYVFVEEKRREKGIGTQLVKGALTLAQKRHAEEVTACVITQNEYGRAAGNMLCKTGFQLADTSTIIRYANDEKCSRSWKLFMEERGRRICSHFAERGFKTLPFNEVPSEIVNGLKNSMGWKFPANLDPFRYISNRSDSLVPEYSFITLKDDEPVSFAAVTTADGQTLVFQQLSTAFGYQGSGIFLLPFAAFMDKFLTGKAYSKASAVIFDRNERMQRLVKSFIGQLAESIKTQKVYRSKL